ncbi:hypothetical protein Tco_1379887 [Tanacetum coccineum]
MNRVEQQEDKITKNAINKRKWQGDHKGSSSQQQNKEPNVIRAHTAGPSNKEGYAGNLPLCNKWLGHYKRDCAILKCQNRVDKYWKGKARGDSSVTMFNVKV